MYLFCNIHLAAMTHCIYSLVCEAKTLPYSFGLYLLKTSEQMFFFSNPLFKHLCFSLLKVCDDSLKKHTHTHDKLVRGQ